MMHWALLSSSIRTHSHSPLPVTSSISSLSPKFLCSLIFYSCRVCLETCHRVSKLLQMPVKNREKPLMLVFALFFFVRKRSEVRIKLLLRHPGCNSLFASCCSSFVFSSKLNPGSGCGFFLLQGHRLVP